MADKIKDAEDRLLEALLAAEPIADAGFSGRVLHRIRRRIWIRRLALPTAMLIGGVIAIKPLLQLLTIGAQLLSFVPQEIVIVPAAWLSQLPIILLGAALLIIGMLSIRMLEE